MFVPLEGAGREPGASLKRSTSSSGQLTGRQGGLGAERPWKPAAELSVFHALGVTLRQLVKTSPSGLITSRG